MLNSVHYYAFSVCTNFYMCILCRLDDVQKSTSLNNHTVIEDAVDRSQSPSVVSDCEASPNLALQKTIN